ncbi:protein kinase domain-containing protein [Streptacidiphilus jiangxiensis]|uniref:non-specific serine/threonine protein kinase n=1 Tax=Streptacidiphilus jiangxiensis TaxID=235985 RepID=A0A1H7HQW8_STRJI|nr:protein kinase [Streptacidiphilus jiangxiensis]SEK50605.1 Serine/threonine protein kinase [Streptacidiphilus jiangxiensis]
MPGRILANRYELTALLGRGGMGEVWTARDTRIERQVAVKLLKHDPGTDDAAELFLREARTAGGLTHPGIVTIHDLGQDDDGTLYLVMELLTGRDLAQVLRHDGPPALDAALDWTAQMCDALTVAHDAGIVHRDLKPANVLLTPAGTVKILDFGIARYTSTITQASRIIGTPHYMPPERLMGKTGDGRGDLYSLGCMLHELLTGATPFTDPDTAALMFAHVQRAPEPPSLLRPGLPPTVDELVLDLLAKAPEDRPPTARAVTDRIRSLISTPAKPGRAGYSPTVIDLPEPDPAPALDPAGPAPAPAPAPATPTPSIESLSLPDAAYELGRLPVPAALDALRRLPHHQVPALLERVPAQLAAEALREMGIDHRCGVLQRLPPSAAAAALGQLSDRPDEIAAALNNLPAPSAQRIVEHLAPEVAVPLIDALNPALTSQILGSLQPPQRAADVLTRLAPRPAAVLLERAGPRHAAQLLQLMPPVQAAAALAGMDGDLAIGTLNRMPPSRAGQVVAVLPPRSIASTLMRARTEVVEYTFAALSQTRTVDILEQLGPLARTLLERMGPRAVDNLTRWLGPELAARLPQRRDPR